MSKLYTELLLQFDGGTVSDRSDAVPLFRYEDDGLGYGWCDEHLLDLAIKAFRDMVGNDVVVQETLNTMGLRFYLVPSHVTPQFNLAVQFAQAAFSYSQRSKNDHSN